MTDATLKSEVLPLDGKIHLRHGVCGTTKAETLQLKSREGEPSDAKMRRFSKGSLTKETRQRNLFNLILRVVFPIPTIELFHNRCSSWKNEMIFFYVGQGMLNFQSFAAKMRRGGGGGGEQVALIRGWRCLIPESAAGDRDIPFFGRQRREETT